MEDLLYKIKVVNIKSQVEKERESRVSAIIESKISRKNNGIRTFTDNLFIDKSENVDMMESKAFR